MPTTLRRSRRRELVLTRSFTKAIQDKVRLESPRADGKECRAFLADLTNSHTTLASTFEASAVHVPTSRPSMIFSLYHSSNPHLPIHPIHRLPPELLVHVFALGSVDNVMFPVLVSHVCHSWRAIASHAHSLWRRVSLTPDSNIHMWKERIRRARLCTLDIILASYPHSKTLYDLDIVTLQMHLLAPHLSALRSLDIRFSSYAPYLWNTALGPLCRSPSYLWDHRSPNKGDLPSNVALQVPKLESLTLRYPKNDDTKEFSLFGGFAPKLARATLEGVRLTWLPKLFGNLSFLDYTHHGFNRGDQAIDEILSMLQVSSRLRELKLCICHKAEALQMLHLQRPLIGGDNVALPFLESLSLRVDREDSDIPAELVTILSRLSIPEAKNLYLQDLRAPALGPPSRDSRPFTTLPTFIGTIRCKTSLSNLMAEGRWVEPSLLLGLAAQLPSLKSIQIGDMATLLG